MVVPTYILGPSFTKIEDIMKNHYENIQRKKKGGGPIFFSTYPIPF